MEADTLLSEQFYVNYVSTPIKTLYFYIPISGQSLCQAAVDTFRVYELDFSFVLSSRKQTPEQIESYYVNFITLFVTMNLCQPWCFFSLYIHTSYTSKHRLNFMLVTELQHCQNNSIAKPVLSGPVLSGHPLLSGHLSKSRKSLPLFTVNLTSIKWSPLLSGRGHPF